MISFPSLARREARGLYGLGSWDDLAPDDSLVAHGNAGRRLARADQFVEGIDAASAIADVDILVRSNTRVMCWPRDRLHPFLHRRPDVAFALVAFLALAIAGATPASGTTARLPLARVADLALPGNPTRLDYQSLDPQRHLLFIAHLGDSCVIVVDTKARRVVATVPNVSDVHGVLAIPELGTAYASATGTNEVVAIRESSLKIVARTGGGVYPDGIAFDPIVRRVFVSNEHGGSETVIDVRSNERIATIALGGEAGNTQYDPESRHLFVNVQTLQQLVEIDPARNAIVKRYSLAGSGCIGNHGLLIDARTRRAFIACEDSGTLLWFDLRTMRAVRDWPTGEGPDVLALDTKTKRLFVASESGTVSAFSDGARVAPIARAFLGPAAHTVAVDSETQLVYFPLENVGGKPVLRIMEEHATKDGTL